MEYIITYQSLKPWNLSWVRKSDGLKTNFLGTQPINPLTIITPFNKLTSEESTFRKNDRSSELQEERSLRRAYRGRSSELSTI